ncbi:hypothetical protein [Synechococcus elongatus]|uniref:hypothetical protein n=1 Tax=Synechococcus elongatus TaxID=32046 RepID=UPI000F7FA0B9|nr:hypothetical protein [Synechococcus elongatus]
MDEFSRRAERSSSSFLHRLVVFLLQLRGVEDLSAAEVYCLLKLLRHGVLKARNSFYRFKFYLEIPYKSLVSLLSGWTSSGCLTDAVGKAAYSEIFKSGLQRLQTVEIPGVGLVGDPVSPILQLEFECEEEVFADPDIPFNTLFGFKEHWEGHARKYYLLSFSKVIVETLCHLYLSADGRLKLKQLIVNSTPLNDRPAPINRASLEEFAPPERIDHFLAVAEIIRCSTYRIDWDLVFSDEIAQAIQQFEWKIDHWVYFLVTLSHLGPQSEAQYHPTVSMQRTGRFHTHGGIMLLPQWLRHRIVKPVNPDYCLVELDLCSAQLLLASRDWDAPETTRLLLEIIDRGESVWKYIAPEITDKKIKKVIIYSFIFGCDLRSLLFLTLRGAKQKVKQEVINAVLASPLLQPLVAGRDRLLSSLYDLIQGGGHIEVNQLGLIFDADQYLARAKADKPKASFDDVVRKVARQLLAHRLQGAEQAIIHPLMLEIQDQGRNQNLPYALNCSSYDGLTYEVHPDYIDRFQQDCTDWLVQNFPNSRLEFKVIPHS